MKYRNASHVLPDKLVKEIQKYVNGEAIYIPKPDEKKKWGEGSVSRTYKTNHLCKTLLTFFTKRDMLYMLLDFKV